MLLARLATQPRQLPPVWQDASSFEHNSICCRCTSTAAFQAEPPVSAARHAGAFSISMATLDDVPDLAATCAEAFIAETPQEGPGALRNMQIQGQQALLKYAERTLSAQIYKGYHAKRKAQRERRAARMEAQAACMRAELAQLSGDGTRRLWPGIPSTIQRRTEQRQRTAQHFVWMVARAQAPQGYAATAAQTWQSESDSSPQALSGTQLPSLLATPAAASAAGGPDLDLPVNHSLQNCSNSSRKGPIIGCAMITLAAAEAWLPPPWPTKAPQRAYVGNMACLPSWRRRGVASALLRRCERVAEWWQYDSVWLHTEVSNTSARMLYRRAGYQVAREDPWFYGRMQQVLLSKALHPRGLQKGVQEKHLQSQQSIVDGHSNVQGTYVWNVHNEQ